MEDSRNIVKLDAESNGFCQKTQTDTQLSTLSSLLSSKDIPTTIVGFSNCVGSKLVSKENGSVSGGADWLNKLTPIKLTANKKPGGEKRKRDGSDASDSVIVLTKKRRGGK